MRRTSLAITGLILLFAATVAIRVVAYSAPEVSNRVPLKPYSRSINYADAADNVVSGRGQVVNTDRVGRMTRVWMDSDARLPPEPAGFAVLANDTYKPIFDEQGYLLLQVGLAKMTGAFKWSNVLFLQALLSGVATLLVFLVVHRLRRGWMPWLLALLYALHPLEFLLAVGPDVPIWAVYASVVSAAIVLSEWRIGRWTDWILLLGAGVFLGLCIVIRAPTLGIVFITLCGLLFISPRTNGFAALLVAIGAVLTIGGVSATGSDTSPVGRSATFHTLLGGLAEFGDIDGLEWLDSSLHEYILARHDVELYTPEFNEAARTEYLNVIRERPALLVSVPAQRLFEFIVAYRPGKSSVAIILVFGMFKILAIVSAIVWWRHAGDAAGRRRVLAYLAVASATVMVHVPIVPLLEIYIASFFVLWGFPIAGLGAQLVYNRFAASAAGGQ